MNTLEKEFVPYEPSLDMKELGFDEPCFGTYLSSFQSNCKVYELILEMGMNEEFEDNRNVYLLEGACSAPTFSQAFRWFRKKYKIHSIINLTIIGTWYFELYDLNDKRNAEIKTNQNEFETPEEAELACLIKLIEIANEQQ